MLFWGECTGLDSNMWDSISAYTATVEFEITSFRAAHPAFIRGAPHIASRMFAIDAR